MPMTTRWGWFWTVAIGLLLATAPGYPAHAHAQAGSPSGSVAGTVLDPVGKTAIDVIVQVRDGQGGVVGRATSDADGRYTVAGVPPGSYDVIVTIPGLKAFERKGVVVGSAAVTVDIRLEEGSQLSTLGEDPAGIAADRARRAPPEGPTPRTADGRPDLSGVWWAPTVVNPGRPEWLPGAQRVAAERQANNRIDSPQVHCLPAAVLRRGPLVQFVQSKDVIVEITDDDSPGFHLIYLSRTHPAEQDPLWHGDSVGRWEGDTLVVDRLNFVEPVWLDAEGHPHSDRLHIVERYRRTDLGRLEIEITVDDPGVLVRPWTFTRVSELAPKEEIREFICNENNSDLSHLVRP